MLKRNLILLLLAFLACLQGLVPLLHAHASGALSGTPHVHVSPGTSADVGTHFDVLTLRAPGETVVEAADGLPREAALVPVHAVPVLPGAVSVAVLLPCRFGGPVDDYPSSGLVSFSRPPARAPPLRA